MENFYEFSKAIGLVVNPQKCKVYDGGVCDQTKTEIHKIISYGEGKLPFRHFEIPLTTKKLSKSYCLEIVEKMVKRIKYWSNTLLSYAGRLQLIKSVLFAITYYWLQCLPMPKKIIKKIFLIRNELIGA